MTINCSISVVFGCITKQFDCDGIVSSVNESIAPEIGISETCWQAAGGELEKYINNIKPLAIGNAVATPGFNLQCRIIVHAHSPTFHSENAVNHLIDAFENALLVADQESVTSLAIPAIGTGGNFFPHEDTVPILLKTAYYRRLGLSNISEIRFVTLSKPVFEHFRQGISNFEAAQLLQQNKTPNDFSSRFMRYPD